MKFETAFNCGDQAWIYHGYHTARPQQATVGQIRIEYTDCHKWDDEQEMSVHVITLKEVYMCDETGIGSGTLHTLGEGIFKTREECEAKFATHIAKQEAEKKKRAADSRKEKLGRERDLRGQLAEIERLKAEEQ